jgi:hypothetical protein
MQAHAGPMQAYKPWQSTQFRTFAQNAVQTADIVFISFSDVFSAACMQVLGRSSA